MTINLKKIILINLIISILAYYFFSSDTQISIYGVVFLGVISSILFNENSVMGFLKMMTVNAVYFYFLLGMTAHFELFIVTSKGEGDLYRYEIMLNQALFYMILYLSGYFNMGVALQVIREKFQKKIA